MWTATNWVLAKNMNYLKHLQQCLNLVSLQILKGFEFSNKDTLCALIIANFHWKYALQASGGG